MTTRQSPLRELPCPTCRKPVRWTSAAKFRPFCSERCRLIDLGEWASERFRIPARESATDIDGQLPPGPPLDDDPLQ